MENRDPELLPESQPNPFEAGTRVPWGLDSPCRVADWRTSIQCGRLDGYIEVNPHASVGHVRLSCGDGHYVKFVKHDEVRLKLGLPPKASKKAAVRDLLDPPARVEFFVLARDRGCVYCGVTTKDLDTDGKPIRLSIDHLIPRALIDLEDIRRDRDLLEFARDVQTITACTRHNSGKASALLRADVAEALFTRCVLENDVTGAVSVSRLHRFRTLLRLARRNEESRANQP